MISISGVFAVTFSVVFAYVADVTEEHERSQAYGLVKLSFCAQNKMLRYTARSVYSCYVINKCSDIGLYYIMQVIACN